MSEMLRIPVDRELSDRVRWLIRVRWLALVAAIVVILIADYWLGGVLPLAGLGAVLLLIAGYNLLLWVATDRLIGQTAPWESLAMLMHVQVIVDLFALTALLHFSGGIENPFSAYYVLVVVIGSILMTRRDSYLYAGVASALWVGLLIAEATGILPHHNLVGFRLPVRYREAIHIVAEGFVLASINFGAAYFISGVIEKLREGERQLYEANASCEIRAGQLEELNARLQELDRTRSLFIRLVTHELRAPVAAIQSYLRLILDGYVPEERLMEIIGKAEQRARDQLDLIADLLDLARVQEVREEAAKPVDAAAILRDVVDMLQARADDKALTIEVRIEPSVPYVLASDEHVKQIWVNLISNAIKYTPEGGRVTITLCEQEDMVRGTVEDTGIGISPEDQAHLFETFFRTEAAKAMAHHGTGLGLAITKGVVERYGGRIWVESEVGRGSTFSFELPKARLPSLS